MGLKSPFGQGGCQRKFIQILLGNTRIFQHLKQQGTIILPVFYVNHQQNLPKFVL